MPLKVPFMRTDSIRSVCNSTSWCAALIAMETISPKSIDDVEVIFDQHPHKKTSAGFTSRYEIRA